MGTGKTISLIKALGGSGAGGTATPVDPTLTVAGAAADAEVTGKKISKLTEEIAFKPEAYGLPVLRLTGDTSAMTKDDAVDLAYEYGDLVGICSVKWQGSSSLAWDKKNYTVKFDTAFEAKEGWGAQKKYCLKANYIDASHARNVVNAKLWGQVVKSRPFPPNNIGNLPNAGAIDGFPCIVMLNDEFHGLFTWNIPKDGWMFGFDGTEQKAAIVCAEGNSSGFNVEAFRETVSEWGTGFELEYITNETDEEKAAIMTSLNNLISACINSDGTDLDTVVAKYIDWDSVIDFYCFAMLIGGFDLIVKNYLLVTFDGVKWRMGAYDMDSTHGLNWTGVDFVGTDVNPLPETYPNAHRLMNLVRKYKYNELVDRYKELRAGVLSDDNVIRTFSNFVALIPAEVYRADLDKWPMIPNSAASNLAQIAEFYRMRSAVVDAEMYVLGAPAPVIDVDASWYKGTTDPTTITKINFVTEYTETGAETESWDAGSLYNPGTLKGYITGDMLTVAITNGAKNIMTYGGSGMFRAFTNVVEITGTELLIARKGFSCTMGQACYLLGKLTTPVHIPEGVNDVSSLYTNCAALTKPGTIPTTAKNASRMYDGCSALTEIPKLPPRLENMNQMFRYCNSLRKADGVVIPETVTHMADAFNQCGKLIGTMKVNAVNIAAYEKVFNGTPLAGQGILYLVGRSTQLHELAATNANGTVVVAI